MGFGRVWVTGQISNRLYELDPATGKIVKSIAVGREPIGVAAGAGAVWVANATDGTVSKINPSTGTVTATVPVTGSPTHLVAAAGSVWVASRARPADASGGGIRIGVVVDCAGFSFQLQQTIAGAELPLIQRGAQLRGKQPSGGLTGATVAGQPVKLLTACKTFGDRSTVISALSKLVEIEGADIVISPPQNRDAIATREYARSHPHTTFIAAGGEQATTLKHSAANLYRFVPDPVQLFAGLGAYARHTLGWKTAATVSNSDESSWPSVAGFDTEFCSLGGHVPKADRVWVDIDDDQGRHLPTGVDGVFLQGGGFGPFGGSGTFVPKWGKLHPPVGRHLVVGWSVLWPVPQLVGVVGASTDPYKSTQAWQHYLDAFAKAFPGVDDSGLANQPYYDSMEPLLEALEQVHGDLSGGQAALMSALATLQYHSPEGLIRLDSHHQAIVSVYLAKVVRHPDKTLGFKQFATLKNVEQTFGGHFSPTTPALSMAQPPCTRGNPPPWAR